VGGDVGGGETVRTGFSGYYSEIACDSAQRADQAFGRGDRADVTGDDEEGRGCADEALLDGGIRTAGKVDHDQIAAALGRADHGAHRVGWQDGHVGLIPGQNGESVD
jgi:hypothetical protein